MRLTSELLPIVAGTLHQFVVVADDEMLMLVLLLMAVIVAFAGMPGPEIGSPTNMPAVVPLASVTVPLPDVVLIEKAVGTNVVVA